MGSGEIVGNQSVHWRFRHHDNSGNPKNLSCVPGNNPGGDEVTAEGQIANGKDPIVPGDIGVKHGHPGQFLVTLRYETMADAAAAGPWVAKNVRPGAGGYFLYITVPAITTRPNQNANPPAEIRVDW